MDKIFSKTLHTKVKGNQCFFLKAQRCNGGSYTKHNVEVTKVGREYIYCKTIDNEKLKFYKDTGLQDVDYGPIGYLFSSEQEFNDLCEIQELKAEIYNKLPDDINFVKQILQQVFEYNKPTNIPIL